MGYTVYVVAKSPKKRDELYAALKKALRHEELCKELGIDMVGARLAMGVKTEDNDSLSYCAHKLAVGFDYSSWIDQRERAYIYRVIAKAARFIGSTKFYYDGDPEPIWPSLAKPPVLEFLLPCQKERACKAIMREIGALQLKG